MNYDKISGYVLLVGGVVLIVWIIVYSFQIFTGKITVPEVFKNNQIQEIKVSNAKLNISNEEQLKENISMATQEALQKILPSDFISGLINLICWSIFTTIAIFGGSKIASLGVKLISKSSKAGLN